MSQIDTIKAKVAPADAARQYGLQVSPSGMALCPFHIVGTSSISFAPPRAAGLIHSAAPPLPTKSLILREPLSNPSMKLYDENFYCFACGAHGDVIDLTTKLLGLNFTETVHRLAVDFGISPGDAPPKGATPQRPYLSQFRKDELRCLSTLTEYERLLRLWKKQYAPKTPDTFRVPAETQRSGFGGKRTSSGMSELSPQGGREGYEACEDAEACQMLDTIEYLAGFLCAASLEERVKTVDDLLQNGLIEKIRNRLEEVNIHGRAA